MFVHKDDDKDKDKQADLSPYNCTVSQYIRHDLSLSDPQIPYPDGDNTEAELPLVLLP